jgi:phosphatidylglycerophosphate synthase
VVAACSARRSASGSAPGSRSARTGAGWRPPCSPWRTWVSAVWSPSSWSWPIGLLALIGWQLAYAFDCADGQLARVTGRTSAAGGRLDVLCDVAVQISLVAALAAIAKTQVDDTPAWLLAAFAGTWMINLITSVMQSGAQAASMVTSRSLPIRVVKLVRDYGAVIALAGVVLTVAPQWTVWFVGLFTLINAAFLAASVVFSAREALRA